jgi:hypothetical protein
MEHPNATNPGAHYWGKPWLAAAAALTDYMFTCSNKRAASVLAAANRTTGASVTDSESARGRRPGPPVWLYYLYVHTTTA